MKLGKITAFLGSRAFFLITLSLFTLSSLWIAVSSTYPLAFDEEVHYGFIEGYAESFNPWSIQQTDERNYLGSVTTDPSYLFYYAMSFPYRLLALIYNDDTFIITGLRFINIALVIWAFFLFRRLLIGVRLSRPLVHSVLAVCMAIPIMPLLAATINYDNLIFVITPLLFMATIAVRKGLIEDGVLLPKPAIAAILLMLYGSVIKYAFLPIMVGIAGYLLFVLITTLYKKPAVWRKTWQQIIALSWRMQLAIVIAFAVGLALFSQRYVTNIVEYGSPVPDCGKVLSVEQCMEWGPWGRDYNLAQTKGSEPLKSLPEYVQDHWLHGMWHRLFFTLSGPGNDYATRKWLPVPATTFIVISVAGVVAFALCARRLYKTYPEFIAFTLAGAVYIVVLVMQQYQLYLETGQAVAVNGRYLIPLLPLSGVILGAALVMVLRKLKLAAALPIVAVIALVAFAQGGGVLTYIVRSEPAWLYDAPVIQHTDHILKTITKPWVIGA